VETWAAVPSPIEHLGYTVIRQRAALESHLHDASTMSG
jgi:hypothetical protein